jgi:hypothetical protein
MNLKTDEQRVDGQWQLRDAARERIANLITEHLE